MDVPRKDLIEWHTMEQEPDVDGEELLLIVVRTVNGKSVVATALYSRQGEGVWHIQHVWEDVLNGTIVKWAAMPVYSSRVDFCDGRQK